MSDYIAHISDGNAPAISESDGGLSIKIIGTEQVPITEMVAAEAIEQLKTDPESITIDADGAIVKKDETSI